MSENERSEGKWQGKIETEQLSHGKRISRLEAAFLSIIVALASVGAEAMGILPW